MNESNFPSVDLADYDALFSEFISYPDLENNNDEQSILHTSTPLGLSDLHLAHGTAEQATSAASLNLSVELHTSSTQITSLIQDPPFDLTRRTTPSPHLRQTLQQKRPLSSDAQNSSSDLPGLNCWSLSGGNVPARQPRSCFSKMRRIEVKHMRDLGACLRCRRLKRSCSGGNPCEPCARAADTATKSRCLTWMECFRPSFQAVDIFKPNSVNGTALAKAASNGFFDIGVLRNDTLPYDTMTIQLRSRTLASFLLNNLRMDRYVISTEHAGHFSNIIDGGLGPKLGSLSKALVYLSVHLYYKPAATDLHLAREQVASTLLREIEARVKPSKLQSMQKSELQALILVLLVTIMTLKLRSMDSHILGDPNERRFAETQADALERLLCHYIAKIVQRLSYFYRIEYLLDVGEVIWTFPGSIYCSFRL